MNDPVAQALTAMPQDLPPDSAENHGKPPA